LIDDLKKCNVKTVIFDECHHLQSYWALVMKEVIMQIGVSNIIGLTATPPIDEDKEKIDCYTSLLGEIDYQIPTPAVIKEGMLAPFQDLVYFCAPTSIELEYIKNCHQKFKILIDRFNKQDSDFYFWVIDRIVNRKLISGEIQEWTRFINSKPNYAIAGVKYLLQFKYTLPWDITITETMYEQIILEDWIYLIEDYALNLLKLSSDENDNKLFLEIKDALRNLGFLLSEKGIIKNSSPLDRVLAYSKSKLSAVKEILKTEMEALGDKIRVAIITDFEISNATSLKSVIDVEIVLGDDLHPGAKVGHQRGAPEQPEVAVAQCGKEIGLSRHTRLPNC
jgi:superfamily II DNA or RNA helicase